MYESWFSKHHFKQQLFSTVLIFSTMEKAKNLRIKFKIQLIVNKTWLLSDLLLKTKWFILLWISKKKSYKNKQNDYENVIQHILGFYTELKANTTGAKKIVIKHSSETKRNQPNYRMLVSFIQRFLLILR